MGKLKFNSVPNAKGKENLIVGKSGIKDTLKCFSGKSGDFWISMMPSLNTSGYGDSEKDSMKDLYQLIEKIK